MNGFVERLQGTLGDYHRDPSPPFPTKNSMAVEESMQLVQSYLNRRLYAYRYKCTCMTRVVPYMSKAPRGELQGFRLEVLQKPLRV